MTVKEAGKPDNHFYAPGNKKQPKSDTKPGPGLEYLNGKAGEISAGEMLGEDD